MGEYKSLRSLAWNVDEQTYREDPAYSQSTITTFQREGFEKLDQLFDKHESPSLLFGSVVDTLLLGEDGELEQKYYVCTVPLISDDFKPMILSMKEGVGAQARTLYDLSDSQINGYLEEFGIYQANNWKAETKANKVREACDAYYRMLFLSDGKKIVPKEMFEDAKACVQTLKESENTEWYFRKDNQFDGIERLNQLKFKCKYLQYDVRGMIDKIIVDHKKKLIYLIDLKTSSEHEYNFYKSFIKWGYYQQANLYTYLLKETIKSDEYFKDFKIMPFRFIVINNNDRHPLVWEWNYCTAEDDINITTDSAKYITMVNWRNVLPTLDMYLKTSPRFPIGINPNGVNNLLNSIKQS